MVSRDSLKNSPLPLKTLAAWKNDPIPESDAATARPWLLDAQTELARMSDEIRGLESESKRSVIIRVTRSHLIEQHNALRVSLNIYRVVLAPHKRLPPELLQEIFMCCAALEKPNLSWFMDPACHLDIRRAICQVCSRWRRITLGTHELWATMQASFGRIPTRVLLNVLKIWLSRSGKHPISLDITCDRANLYHHRLASYPGLASLVIQNLPRFRSLSINHCLFTMAPGHADILESLEIGGDSRLLTSPLTTFVQAARLRRVTLRDFHVSTNLGMLAFPWKQLTEFHVSVPFFPAAEYYPVLKKCESLTSATIKVGGGEPLQPAPFDISFPALRKLIVCMDSPRNAMLFFQRFSLKSLTNLSLHLSDKLESAVPSTAIPPSFPVLQRISINCGDYFGWRSDSDIVPLLLASQSAVEVSLGRYLTSQSTLDQIANGSLLPNVQLLSLGRTKSWWVISMLETRQSSTKVSTITEFGIQYQEWDLTPDEIESVRRLVKAGVFISCDPKVMFGGRGTPVTTSKFPLRGEIEKQARCDFEARRGLYAVGA
ncbi:F-box domain-containing protein [Mycena venus]|uniref:F-box domain-containing protein n=1 Tax=Mycena venus TaxID=2733690 RepID=A0A8H6XA29_9AGAR|nr:F-box domain-containing protein [Mycena venus]